MRVSDQFEQSNYFVPNQFEKFVSIHSGFQQVRATPLTKLPVLPFLSSSMRASVNTSAETHRCACRSLPNMPAAFSLNSKGPASALPFSRPAQRSLRLPAGIVAKSLESRSVYTKVLQTMSLPPPSALVLPTGATVVGWDSHPPEKSAFPRRTSYTG